MPPRARTAATQAQDGWHGHFVLLSCCCCCCVSCLVLAAADELPAVSPREILASVPGKAPRSSRPSGSHPACMPRQPGRQLRTLRAASLQQQSAGARAHTAQHPAHVSTASWCRSALTRRQARTSAEPRPRQPAVAAHAAAVTSAAVACAPEGRHRGAFGVHDSRGRTPGCLRPERACGPLHLPLPQRQPSSLLKLAVGRCRHASALRTDEPVRLAEEAHHERRDDSIPEGNLSAVDDVCSSSPPLPQPLAAGRRRCDLWG